jgi:hypothetical protein
MTQLKTTDSTDIIRPKYIIFPSNINKSDYCINSNFDVKHTAPPKTPDVAKVINSSTPNNDIDVDTQSLTTEIINTVSDKSNTCIESQTKQQEKILALNMQITHCMNLLKLLKKQHEEDLQNQLNELNDKCTSFVDKKIKKYEELMKKQKEEINKQIEDLKKQHDEETKKQNEDFIKEYNEISKLYETRCNKETKKQIENFKKQYNEKMDKLNDELNDKHNIVVQQLINQHNIELKNKNDKIKKIEYSLKTTMDAITPFLDYIKNKELMAMNKKITTISQTNPLIIEQIMTYIEKNEWVLADEDIDNAIFPLY